MTYRDACHDIYIIENSVPLSSSFHLGIFFSSAMRKDLDKERKYRSVTSLVLYGAGIAVSIWLFYQLKCRLMGAYVFDFHAE